MATSKLGQSNRKHVKVSNVMAQINILPEKKKNVVIFTKTIPYENFNKTK